MDAPWKMALFTQAINQTRKIGVVLAAMEWSVSEGNSKEWSSEFWKNGSAGRAKRLHQMASDFIGCNTPTIQDSSYRSTFRAKVKSHTS